MFCRLFFRCFSVFFTRCAVLFFLGALFLLCFVHSCLVAFCEHGVCLFFRRYVFSSYSIVIEMSSFSVLIMCVFFFCYLFVSGIFRFFVVLWLLSPCFAFRAVAFSLCSFRVFSSYIRGFFFWMLLIEVLFFCFVFRFIFFVFLSCSTFGFSFVSLLFFVYFVRIVVLFVYDFSVLLFGICMYLVRCSCYL